MAEFAGNYKFVSDDGKFGDFLKATGVGWAKRSIAATTKPSIEITVKDDGTIVLKTISTLKTTVLEFKIGQEFQETRADDVKCQTVITREGNKLIQKQAAEPPVEIVREFNGDKMTTTCKCQDQVCVRQYQKA